MALKPHLPCNAFGKSSVACSVLALVEPVRRGLDGVRQIDQRHHYRRLGYHWLAYVLAARGIMS